MIQKSDFPSCTEYLCTDKQYTPREWLKHLEREDATNYNHGGMEEGKKEKSKININ